MAEHQIEFLNKGYATYSVSIDGKEIVLSRSGNSIKYGDKKTLSQFLDRLGSGLSEQEPFADLCRVSNGCNMLTLLDAFYREKTLAFWHDFYKRNQRCSVFRSLAECFGCRFDLGTCPSNLLEELMLDAQETQQDLTWLAMTKDADRERQIKKSKAAPDQYIAKNGRWCVERVPVNENNTITFHVNGSPIDLCVAHCKENGDPHRLLQVIMLMEDGFSSDSPDKVMSAVSKVGASAALRIMDVLFHEMAVQFFLRQFEKQVKKDRIPPFPNRFIKSYFQQNCYFSTPFFADIITNLESIIPELEQYLIDSSESEMRIGEKSWRLFYKSNGKCYSKVFNFPYESVLREELQEYYIWNADPYITAGKAWPRCMNSTYASIKAILDNMDPIPASVHSISVWNMRASMSKMMANRFSISSIRRCLFAMKDFLAYCDPELPKKVIPDSLIPPRLINPTEPITPYVVKQILKYQSELPEHVLLAFKVLLQTGARMDSVCSMQTSQLKCKNGKWFLKLYYGKTENIEAASGHPSTRFHELSDGLGPELDAFIKKTENIRARLSVPYVFVYNPNIYRKGANRTPRALNGQSFRKTLTLLCSKHHIVDRQGMPAKCTAMMIRAEVGRGLLSQGKTLQETAMKLGNSTLVVSMHYNKRYPADEAKMHRALFAETIDSKIGYALVRSEPDQRPNSPLYGKCHDNSPCHNHNDCRTCSISFTCKEQHKGSEKWTQQQQHSA